MSEEFDVRFGGPLYCKYETQLENIEAELKGCTTVPKASKVIDKLYDIQDAIRNDYKEDYEPNEEAEEFLSFDEYTVLSDICVLLLYEAYGLMKG